MWTCQNQRANSWASLRRSCLSINSPAWRLKSVSEGLTVNSGVGWVFNSWILRGFEKKRRRSVARTPGKTEPLLFHRGRWYCLHSALEDLKKEQWKFSVSGFASQWALVVQPVPAWALAFFLLKVIRRFQVGSGVLNFWRHSLCVVICSAAAACQRWGGKTNPGEEEIWDHCKCSINWYFCLY